MKPLVHQGHGTLLRDLLIFQAKLIMDAVKDVLLIKISIVAAVFDVLFGRRGRPLLFYRVLRTSERFDLWLNLYAPAADAERVEDGLFGASEAGDRSFVGKLEEMVRERIGSRQAGTKA